MYYKNNFSTYMLCKKNKRDIKRELQPEGFLLAPARVFERAASLANDSFVRFPSSYNLFYFFALNFCSTSSQSLSPYT